MKNSLQLALAAGLAVLVTAAGGCAPEATGTVMTLGPVSYDDAFCAARTVMAQYFRLDDVDQEAGRITTRPEFIESTRFSVSDSAPDKQLAELALHADGPYVVARLTIAIRRRGSEAMSTFGAEHENYAARPGRTPAEIEAATTPQQNDVWQTYKYDHMLERAILRDLDRMLRPKDAPTPPTTNPVQPE